MLDRNQSQQSGDNCLNVQAGQNAFVNVTYYVMPSVSDSGRVISASGYLETLDSSIKALVEAKQFNKAIDIAKEFLALPDASKYKRYAEVLSNIGNAYLDSGDKSEAVKYYNLSIGINDKISAPHINLGRMYFEEKQYQKAEHELNTALALDDKNVFALNMKAVLYDYAFDKTAEAQAIIERAIEINPSFWDAYANLAIYQSQNGDLTVALENIKKAIAASPGFGEQHAILGTILTRILIGGKGDGYFHYEEKEWDAIWEKNRSRLQEVIVEFEKARELGVREKDALAMNLGTAYTLDKLPLKAINVLIGHLDSEKYGSEVRFALAQAYLMLGDLDNALKYYLEIAPQLPDNITVLNALGKIYFDKKNYPEAIKYLKKASDIEPENISLLGNLAAAHILNETYDTALKVSTKLYELGSRDERTLLILAKAYEKKGLIDSAQKACEELIGLLKKKSTIQDYVQQLSNNSKYLSMLGKHDKAIETMRMAVAIEDSHVNLWKNLMILLVQRNDKESDREAEDVAKKILSMQPDEDTKKVVAELTGKIRIRRGNIIRPTLQVMTRTFQKGNKENRRHT
jgi:tetratricopeptide (TPR) repeat protein